MGSDMFELIGCVILLLVSLLAFYLHLRDRNKKHLTAPRRGGR